MTDAEPEEALDTELATVLELLASAVPSILPAPGASGWPYELEDGQFRDEPAASHSTSAMIGYTLAALGGRLSASDQLADRTLTQRDLSLATHHEAAADRGYDCAMAAMKSLVPADTGQGVAPDAALEPEQAQIIRTELQTLFSTLNAFQDSKSRRARAGVQAAIVSLDDDSTSLTQSSLFGDDDPLTLDWLVRLCATEPRASGTFAGLLSQVRAVTVEKIAKIRELGPEDYKLGRRSKAGPTDEFVTHLWPVLRVGYLARSLKPIDNLDSLEELLFRYFSEELAQQLGFAEVRDSSFDVARLIFALDGVTLCKPASLFAGLLQRSLEIIVSTHEVDPRLQPRRPFKVTPTGGVHIPITVEVFQSLIRVVRRLPSIDSRFSALQQLLPVFRRYTAYLQASIVDVRIKGEAETYRGWASDHEYSSAAKIETWFTSQAILYLLMYGAFIREHAARAHLKEVRLSTRPIGDEIPRFFEDAGVLQKLATDFALGQQKSGVERTRWSMLLYGPPGTGKTTIVEQVARQLDWPILELSPSHFVDRGVDRVEERAAQLFRVLGHQNEAVVLFDEIDRLVLDRSSEEYGRQGDMFQFMTPSMLTKLNDLRRGKRVMFAIATNYAWRIDSAILRPGRVDESYLILPPSAAYRRTQIQRALPTLAEDGVEVLVRRTTLASWTEIHALCKSLKERSASPGLTDVDAVCSDFSPTIQLRNYDREVRTGTDGTGGAEKSRLSGKPAEYLYRELTGLYGLIDETADDFTIPTSHAFFIQENLSADAIPAHTTTSERVRQWLPAHH